MALSPADLREKIADSKKPKTRKKAWEAPDLESFSYGSVLAFDQTLTNTGVAWVINDHEGLRALDCTTLVTKTTAKGHEGSIQKGLMLDNLLWDLVDGVAGRNADVFVYEQPAVQGYRLESSLMAALMIRKRWPSAVGIYNQHAKAVMLHPDKRSEKRHVKEAVEALIPNFRRTGVWNQHVHDAVMLGLTYLHDVKEEMDRV